MTQKRNRKFTNGRGEGKDDGYAGSNLTSWTYRDGTPGRATATGKAGDGSVWLTDPDVTLYHGDCLEVLRELPSGSVHMCATSPPFYGLRDYGTGEWEGGDPDCRHLDDQFNAIPRRDSPGGFDKSQGRGNQPSTQATVRQFRETCDKCGARRVDRQIGLEETPEQWVERLVAVFREVRRVLRDDGTLWVEIGDSYAHPAMGGTAGSSPDGHRGGRLAEGGKTPSTMGPGIKQKDLLGQPWLLAFALRADGWWLRSEIIWARPNPMPESVTDRPTKSHSTVFLLSKKPRYFYDADAIRDPVAPSQVGRVRSDPVGGKSWKERNQHDAGGVYTTGLDGNGVADQVSLDDLGLTGEPGEGGAVEPDADELLHRREAGGSLVLVGSADVDNEAKVSAEPGLLVSAHVDTVQPAVSNVNGPNARSVWTIPTEPTPFAHFATWPQALVRRMILAGTSERGCCPECGAPWMRDTIRGDVIQTRKQRHDVERREGFPHEGQHRGLVAAGYGAQFPRETVGWSPACGCLARSNGVQNPPPPVPCTVLDPFAGSGTTSLVARNHGRHSIGIELNEEYLQIAAKRLQQLSLLADT